MRGAVKTLASAKLARDARRALRAGDVAAAEKALEKVVRAGSPTLEARRRRSRAPSLIRS